MAAFGREGAIALLPPTMGRMPVEMERADFEALVDQALDDIPDELSA